MWRKTVECLERNDAAQVLNLGFYAGIKTLRFGEIIGTNKLFGVDIVDEILADAKKRGIMTYKADLNEPLPRPSDSMDVVIANQVIEHLTNLNSFISEIFRMLKKGGGYLLLTTENLASWHNIFALLAGNQPYTGPELSSRFDVTREWCP